MDEREKSEETGMKESGKRRERGEKSEKKR